MSRKAVAKGGKAARDSSIPNKWGETRGDHLLVIRGNEQVGDVAGEAANERLEDMVPVNGLSIPENRVDLIHCLAEHLRVDLSLEFLGKGSRELAQFSLRVVPWHNDDPLVPLSNHHRGLGGLRDWLSWGENWLHSRKKREKKKENTSLHPCTRSTPISTQK